MKDSNIWLKSVMDATADIIFIKDKDYVFQACNEKMCEFFGLPMDEIINSVDEDHFSLDAVQEFREIDRIVMEENKTVTIEEWVLYPNGSKVLLETVKSPCRDEKGKVIGLIGVGRDITERHNQEVALKEAKEAAEIANQAKSLFLSNMSHEIRTPMNAILGFSEILNQMLDDSCCKNYLDAILASGDSLMSLINDVLDLSKIESGKFDLQLYPVSIENLFNELKVIYEKKATEKSLEFVVQYENLPEAFLMDQSRLRQVLVNLIGNALKFTDSGYILIRAKSEFLDDTWSKAKLVLEVCDTGIGIPEDKQDIIFESFQQLPGQKVEEYGGTGLGLSICRELVKLMGGRIVVESGLYKGSTFRIEFPEMKTAIVQDLISSDTNLFTIDEIKFEPSKILIVDDISFNRELLQLYLNSYGFEILHAGSGKEAVRIAEEELPNIILMDMKMPEMDGYEASSLIKKNPKTKHIPITAVTASAFKEDETRILFVADSYMTKPISKPKLIQELMNFLPWRKSPKLKKPVVRDSPFRAEASNGTDH